MAKQNKIENVDVPADVEGNVTVETVGNPLGAGNSTLPRHPEGSRPQATEPTQPTQQASGEEERSITIALTPRQWALVDRQIERTGQSEVDWWRRFLAPHLRP